MSSYLESLTPNFKTGPGVNFEVGSATVLPESNFFNLKTQLAEFRRFHARSLILHSEGIKNMFDEDAFSNHSKLEVLEKIASFITGIKVAILVVGNFRYITLGQRMLAKHKVGDPT
nr:GDSL esterase/lipase LIP-4-like [Ipomoea batatas]